MGDCAFGGRDSERSGTLLRGRIINANHGAGEADTSRSCGGAFLHRHNPRRLQAMCPASDHATKLSRCAPLSTGSSPHWPSWLRCGNRRARRPQPQHLLPDAAPMNRPAAFLRRRSRIAQAVPRVRPCCAKQPGQTLPWWVTGNPATCRWQNSKRHSQKSGDLPTRGRQRRLLHQFNCEISMKNTFFKALSALALVATSSTALAAGACCVAGAACCVLGMPCCM